MRFLGGLIIGIIAASVVGGVVRRKIADYKSDMKFVVELDEKAPGYADARSLIQGKLKDLKVPYSFVTFMMLRLMNKGKLPEHLQVEGLRGMVTFKYKGEVKERFPIMQDGSWKDDVDPMIKKMKALG